MAREKALAAMLNITFGGPEVQKGMFEYEGLMSCLVKVRIMKNDNHKQNSSNDTTMLKVYIAGELYPIHLYDSAPKCRHSNITLTLQMYNANEILPIALIFTLVVYF